MGKHIRFDWAMKRLLRQKANFDVLEGFLSVLLKDDITIDEILESESNSEREESKYNRVDILVRNGNGDLMLIEVQNERENDYFHRMNFGQAKLVTEHIDSGEEYGRIKRVYSINIVYFDLGQGEDYVYVGNTEFKGMHAKDLLQLNAVQKASYPVEHVSDIFTTYYILKVNRFDDDAHDSLDEWIYFLKNSEIPEGFSAKGLPEAKEKLRIDGLDSADREIYENYIKLQRIRDNELRSALQEGWHKAAKEYESLVEKERRQNEEMKAKLLQSAKLMKDAGMSAEAIAGATGLEIKEIETL